MPIQPGKTMAKRKRSEHYVNNKEFLAALIRYQEDIEIARLQDKPKPVIPRYIGECFLKIATKCLMTVIRLTETTLRSIIPLKMLYMQNFVVNESCNHN
jgi:hypothetical protein